MPRQAKDLSNEPSANRLTSLGRKIERAAGLVSRAEELLDALAFDLLAMAGCGPRGARVMPASRHESSSAAPLDGLSSIPLSRLVRELLEILKDDSGAGTDGLAGWKSVAAIQAALKSRTRQEHSKAAVKQLVYRLRQLLVDNGSDPHLVEGHPRLGYRLAVPRGSKMASGPDNQ